MDEDILKMVQQKVGIKKSEDLEQTSAQAGNSDKNKNSLVKNAVREYVLSGEKSKKPSVTSEQKIAEQNRINIESGLPLEIVDGQIYSFDVLGPEQYETSLRYADEKIKEFEEQGAVSGFSDKVDEISLWALEKADNVLDFFGDLNFPVISKAAEKLQDSERYQGTYDSLEDQNSRNNELQKWEDYKRTIERYQSDAQYRLLIDEIQSDPEIEGLFQELWQVDSDILNYKLNGEDYVYDPTNKEDPYAGARYYDSLEQKKRDIYAKLSSRGYDDISVYAEQYAKYQNDKLYSPIHEYLVEQAYEHPVASTALDIAISPIRGFAGVTDVVAQYAGLNGVNVGEMLDDASSAIRGTVTEKIEFESDSNFSADLKRVLYNAAVSRLENLVALGTFGKAAEFILGLSVASSTYFEAKDRGLSEGYAIANGIMAGIFEIICEHIPLEMLRAFRIDPANTFMPFLSGTLKQIGIEGTTEWGTDVLNETYDYFVNGGLSKYEQAIASGMSPSEYALQFGLQVLETFATGSIAGGGSIVLTQGPSYAIKNVRQVIPDIASGQQIKAAGQTENVISDAKDQGGSLGRTAVRAEKKVSAGKKIGERSLGALERKTITKKRADAVDAILSADEFSSVSKKKKNEIRSSVLSFFSEAGRVSLEQKKILESENGQKVLKKTYEWAMEDAQSRQTREEESRKQEVDDAVKEGKTESLVKNTFEAENSDGQSVRVGGVVSVDDGGFEVIQDTQSGATAKLSDLNIKDEQVAQIYSSFEAAARADIPMTADAVNVALSSYNRYDNTSGEMYALWAYDVYRAGAMGFTFEEFSEMYKNDYSGDITDSQLREIFRIGARNLIKKGKGGVTRIGHKALSKLQAEQVFLIQQLAQKYGRHVILVDGRLTDEEGKKVNAFYRRSDNTIVLSLKSDRSLLLVHFGHEMFHWAKENFSFGGQFLQDSVIEALKRNPKFDYEGIYKEVSRDYEGLSEDELLEEIAAQYFAVALASEESVERIVRNSTNAERSFLEKMVERIKGFVADIKKLLKTYAAYDKTVKAAVNTDIKELSAYAEMFEAVLEKAAENKKPTESDGGVKASVSRTDARYLELAKNPAENEAQLREMVERAAFDSGYTIRAYHGTARGDRVGNVFLPERATSGPMAFFTSSKDIAGNYARDKQDTSLAYDEEYSDYYTQFRVNRNGKSVSVVDLWNMLSFSEKNAIKNKAAHITFDDEAENIVYDASKKYGVGGLDAYRINEHRGNYLSALVAEWLEDGNLYGEEHRFLDVLKLAGIEDAEYRDPDARHEKVYDTYLKLKNPFNTDNVDIAFVEGLESWYAEQDEEKYERDTADADLWDKNNRTIDDVTEKLREDIEDGTTHTWTSIPDFLADYLKSQDFDGIQDRGGKKGGDEHTVYVPFSSEQVKSAELVSYDDNGEIIPLSERFNPGKKDIRYSKSRNRSVDVEYGMSRDAKIAAKESQLNAHKNIFGDNMVPEYVGTGVRYSLTRSREIGEASIKKNNSLKNVKDEILYKGIEVMNAMADVMKPYLDKDGILPPDNYKKSTIFKNGSYGRTGENTTVCVRTLTYEHFKDMVSKKLGRPLSVAESLLCSQKIIDIATYPQCIYCYVAADRKAYDEYLGKYWKAMDKYVKALSEGGDSGVLFEEYLAGRDPTPKQQQRWERWKALAKSGKPYISQADLATREGRQALKDKGGAFAEQVKDAESYAQSASWAKKVEDYRAYNGEILNMKNDLIKKLNEEYGFRMYSFSDYTPAFIVENMQMIIDAAVRGLKSLAYTKDTDYAKIFAKTGQAINVSCYAKYDKEFGTFVEDSRQGASWEETKKLRAENKNVGAVMVCTNDRMVQWALKQDWIDVVIPYHIVKTGTTIANEYEWRNYTADSADKKDGKNANIYPTEHDNKFEIYQRLAEERGITPRFNEWYMMARDGKITGDEYMKLVNEVRLPASELKPVKPEFNLDAAMESFGINDDGSLIEGGFVDEGGYMGGWYKDGVNVSAEVETVASDIEDGKRSVDVEYGMSREAKIKAEEKHGLKASRQRLSESWDEIRDMMDLYEVHDEVITAVEEHIEKIKSRQLSRETAITEGLIPKYEEVLKVAREYTKGSKVSAKELADTINELMWAAHDGNLSTEEFVGAVKVYAEEILRTGKTVNNDLYEEYKDFRKMTREETVYVSQQVYDQYVEEFGSIKNLNKACSGKIRIKPYKQRDRTGRSLDGFYQELTEAFPGLRMDAEADVYHQLFEILGAWQNIQPVATYYSELAGAKTQNDIQYQALLMAEDMMSEILRIEKSVMTVADKYQKQLTKAQHRLEEQYRDRVNRENLARQAREEADVLKKRIERNCNQLAGLIRNETDSKHVPEKFKGHVMQFLNMFVTKNGMERDILVERGTLNLVALNNAYDEYFFKSSSYDEDISFYMKELLRMKEDVTDVKVKRLGVEELRMLDKLVTHFSHIIRHENEIFVRNRKKRFSDFAKIIMQEMDRHTPLPGYDKLTKKFNPLDFEHGMLTPIYFFKNIGTTTVNGNVYEETLFKMFRDLMDGQDKWHRNNEATKNKLAEIREKCHYDIKWKRDADEYTLASGKTIKATAEEILYMRALYVRERGHINRLNHLLEGGVVIESDGTLQGVAAKKEYIKDVYGSRKEFKKKKKAEQQAFRDKTEEEIQAVFSGDRVEQSVVKKSEDEIIKKIRTELTEGDLKMLFASLSDDMIKYGNALVNMLSVDGAELGNEVSMELFGIKKFTEEKYIPISCVKDQFDVVFEKMPEGAVKLKNKAFTKRTTRDASNTVYVRNISDIAVEHMQEMSLYNAMTIPVENLSRIFNYIPSDIETYTEEGDLERETPINFKQKFEAIYGKRGVNYFKTLIKDLNGGNQTSDIGLYSKMLTAFKKSAVYGSLSVAIQQPSAVARALAMVDARYFVPKPFSMKDYREMLEYNPVAGIKEIGRFDTGLGTTATEWILDEKKNALGKIDAALSYLPGQMDRMTWTYIWNAVKRETKAQNKELSGEDLLKKAAERFRDVINYTQVYDSTLSRSEFMRNKSNTAKSLTAFMAEPMLSYNLVRDSARNIRNGSVKVGLKGMGAFVSATILNSLLKSLVTAMRKDDDETNFWEIYMQDVVDSVFDEVFIFQAIPILKDAISRIQGYDVVRPDMTLLDRFLTAADVIISKMAKDKDPSWDEILTLVGAFTAFTGIPLNNVIKDAVGLIKSISGIGASPEFSFENAFSGEGTESSSGETEEDDTPDSVKIYRAIVSGNSERLKKYLEPDEEMIEKYIEEGYSEEDAIAKATENAISNYHSKVVEGLISEDIRIREAAEARWSFDFDTYEELVEELVSLGFEKNDVIKAVEKYMSSFEEKEYESSVPEDKELVEYSDLYRAIEGQNLNGTKEAVRILKENGKEDKNIRSSLTRKFKDVYIEYVRNKDDNGLQRLEQLLLACDVGYTREIFSSWAKEAFGE